MFANLEAGFCLFAQCCAFLYSCFFLPFFFGARFAQLVERCDCLFIVAISTQHALTRGWIIERDR